MAELNKLLKRLEKVQPTEEQFRFSTEQLKAELEEALVIHNPRYTLETLPLEEEHLVVWKAMSSCYYTLASRYAESVRFKIQNDEYFMQDIHKHYMKLGEKYESMYNENRMIEVTTVTRTQTGTNLKAPYYVGDKP